MTNQEKKAVTAFAILFTLLLYFINMTAISPKAFAAIDNLLVKGTSSKLIEVTMRSSTTGQPLGSLGGSDVTVKYMRDGAAAAVELGTAGTLSTLGTWESDCWKETAITGCYQYGVPDAALLTGSTGVTLYFSATGAITAKYRIVLISANLQDADSLGLSRLDDTVGSRLAATDYTEPTDAADISSAVWAADSRSITDGTVSTIPDVTLATTQSKYAPAKAGDAMIASNFTAAPTASTIAAAVWAETTRTLTAWSTLASDIATAVRAGITEDHGSGVYGGTAGTGAITVDHNTGGTDNLRYARNGIGIGAATVRAYVKSDYDAGTYILRGQTITRSDGRWATALYLDHNVRYYIIFHKADQYGPDKVEVVP